MRSSPVCRIPSPLARIDLIHSTTGSRSVACTSATVDHLSDVVLIYQEVVRSLGLHKPVVVGQSFGGMIAAELTSAFPQLASKVVLFDPVGLWRDDLPVANWIATPPAELPALLFHDPGSPAAQSRPVCRMRDTHEL